MSHVCTPVSCPDEGHYYVSAQRDVRTALLLGPFGTHAEALAVVRHAELVAQQVDPWSAFDAFGTVRMADGTRQGLLNNVGLDWEGRS